jgi:DNA modification methylase
MKASRVKQPALPGTGDEIERVTEGRPDEAGSRIIVGDALSVLCTLPDSSARCCISSPPYWALRDYEIAPQIGAEGSVLEYIESLCRVFEEVRRVLQPDGSLWVNIGDSFSR